MRTERHGHVRETGAVVVVVVVGEDISTNYAEQEAGAILNEFRCEGAFDQGCQPPYHWTSRDRPWHGGVTGFCPPLVDSSMRDCGHKTVKVVLTQRGQLCINT